jgi:two-component system, response regulator YesN
MFTALIAEDSKPILRHIQSLLASSVLPVQVVSAVTNGEDALAFIRQHPVDILLTDIRMPKLDGLALIEQAKQLRPQLKVVLISSYSDFEYTRKAITLQVFDYLLKPVERPALIEVMERIIGKLYEQRADRLDVFRGIVDEEFLAGMNLGEQFYEPDTKLALLLCKQPFTADTDCLEAGMIQSVLAPICSPHSCWVFPVEGSNRFLVLAHPHLADKYENAGEWMNAIAKELLEQNLQVSIAGSLQAFDLGNLSRQYEKLEQGLREELCVAAPVLLDMDHRHRQQREEDRAISAFSEMIHGKQKEQFQLKLSELLQRWLSVNVPFVKLEELLQVISDAFTGSVSENGSPDLWSLGAEAKELLKLDSYERFSGALLEWTGRHFDLLIARSRKSAEELFEQIESCMQLHKYSQLSISDLALKFHVSPSYISRIIKRYTNKTFVHLYVEMKMEEACKLMRAKPEMKIKELADALSFGDQHYFSRVFKEYTGYSPTEYKEQLSRGFTLESGEH